MVKLNLFAIGGLSLAISCAILIAINIIFGRKKVHFIWSLFNLSVAIWGFGAFMVGISPTPEKSWFWWKINHIGIIWISVFVLHTVYFLTTRVNRKILIFAYISTFCFQIIELLPSHMFFKDIRTVSPSFYFATPGVLYHPFLLLWLIFVGYAHVCTYKEFRVANGIKKQSLLYFLVGSAVGFTGGLTNFLIAYRLDIPPYGNFTIPIYCIMVTYAILKYRLMDIRVAISRGAAFLIAYPFLIGIPIVLAYKMYPVFYPSIGIRYWLIPMGVLVLFSIASNFIFNQIKRRMENTLLADQKRYQSLLLQAASGMVRERNLDKLSKLIVYIVKRVVKIEFVSLFLEDKEQKEYRLKVMRDSGKFSEAVKFSYEHPFAAYLKTRKEPVLYEELPLQVKESLSSVSRVNLIVPAFTERSLLGFVLLGNKLNQSNYSQDDINVFTILASQVSLAIENCIFFEEFRKFQEKIFSAEKLATVGGLADGVAHQIRNRLNLFSIAAGDTDAEVDFFIRDHPQLLTQNPELQKSLAYIRKAMTSILTNVKHTASVINGILNYARVEEKEGLFDEFSLSEIIQLALELAKVKHQIVQFPLEESASTQSTIYAIKSQIMECIFNTVDNAYEAICEKKDRHLQGQEKEDYKPYITIRLLKKPDSNTIEISDNGIGVKEEDASKIFAPFFTTKSSYISGTGIGMYVVKRMIEENHKGKIWFTSRYMEGTTFYIELPKKGMKL